MESRFRIVLYFFKTGVYYLSMSNKTNKHPTTRKCLFCDKSHSRIRALYCSKKCSQKQHTKRNQESFKMDFQDFSNAIYNRWSNGKKPKKRDIQKLLQTCDKFIKLNKHIKR